MTNKLYNSQGKRLYTKRKHLAKAKEERMDILHCKGLLKYKDMSISPYVRTSQFYQINEYKNENTPRTIA